MRLSINPDSYNEGWWRLTGLNFNPPVPLVEAAIGPASDDSPKPEDAADPSGGWTFEHVQLPPATPRDSDGEHRPTAPQDPQGADGLIYIDLMHDVDIGGLAHAKGDNGAANGKGNGKGGGKKASEPVVDDPADGGSTTGGSTDIGGSTDTSAASGKGNGKGAGNGKGGGKKASDPVTDDPADSGSTAGGSTDTDGSTDTGGSTGTGSTGGTDDTGGSTGTVQPGVKTYTSGSADGSGFNITLEFQGTWSDSLYKIFTVAADMFSELIIGDLPNMNMGTRVIDDIYITAQLISIDGSGGILGQAGPTSLRADSYLPASAMMIFDSADATAYQSKGLFDDIVFHEMGHALGFGSLWNYFGLVSGGSAYTGAHANAEYRALGGTAPAIAVETDYGAGTAGAHWDEAAFRGELMTGILNGTNFFSAMSAASFADLGYQLSDYTQLAWVDSTHTFA